MREWPLQQYQYSRSDDWLMHYLRCICLFQFAVYAPVFVVDHQWIIREALWHLYFHNKMLLWWLVIGSHWCCHLLAPKVYGGTQGQHHSLILSPCLLAFALVSWPGLLETVFRAEEDKVAAGTPLRPMPAASCSTLERPFGLPFRSLFLGWFCYGLTEFPEAFPQWLRHLGTLKIV